MKRKKPRGLPPEQMRLLADLWEEEGIKTILRSLQILEVARADDPDPEFPDYLREMHQDTVFRLDEAIKGIEKDEDRRAAEGMKQNRRRSR
jgi:hypothetical protein